MVRPRAALGDQFVADPPRERKVSDPVAVKMTELAPADPELDAAEPVRRSLNARPRRDGLCDLFSGCHISQPTTAGVPITRGNWS